MLPNARLSAVIFIAGACGALAQTTTIAQFPNISPSSASEITPVSESQIGNYEKVAANTLPTNPALQRNISTDSVISSAPSTLCNYTSISTAFVCDLTRVNYFSGHSITGSSLGEPSSGYLYTPNAYNVYTYTYNRSGWNQSSASNSGRTMAADHFSKIDNYGQGDAVNLAGLCFVDSSKAAATDFLANPECGIVAGEADAGTNGVFEDLDEQDCNDDGYDIACIGVVRNLKRTVSTGALHAWWGGVRVQSIGSAKIDNAFSATGSMRVAIDLTGQKLDTNTYAGMVTPRGWRWYGNGTHGVYIQDGLGTDWIEDSGGLSGWNFVVGNSSRFQVSPRRVTAASSLVVTAGFLRPPLTTFSNLSRADPNPQAGDMIAVSDAVSCKANFTVRGGGSVSCSLIYSGTTWKAAVTH